MTRLVPLYNGPFDSHKRQGQLLLSSWSNEDAHVDTRYKQTSLLFSVLRATLVGNYVNFGACRLYGDPALDDALRVVQQLMSAIDVNRLTTYPKVCRSYHGLLEALCANHIEAMDMGVDANGHLQVVRAIELAIRSQGKRRWYLLSHSHCFPRLTCFYSSKTM